MKLSKLTLTLALVATTAIFLSQCSEQQNEMNVQQESGMAPTPFNVNVGSKIPNETAIRWIAKANNSMGRKGSYTLSYKNNSDLVRAEQNLGVALHHAYDESGNYNILAIAVVKGIPFWESPLIVNTNTGEVMNNRTAKAWANAYTKANPNGIRYHFFGRLTIEQTFPHNLRIIPAVNDLGEPQLVLASKDASAGAESFYDMSMPCPLFCDPISLQ